LPSFLEDDIARESEDSSDKIVSIVDRQEENFKKNLWSHLFLPNYFIEGSREKAKGVHSLLDELQMGAELTMVYIVNLGFPI